MEKINRRQWRYAWTRYAINPVHAPSIRQGGDFQEFFYVSRNLLRAAEPVNVDSINILTVIPR